MRDIVRLSFVLTIVAVAAGLAIALTYRQTKDQKALQEKRAQQQALRAAFPEGVAIEAKEGGGNLPSEYWIAKKGDETVAYAFRIENRGYSSILQYYVGVAPDGAILGVTILSQAETPGLGTRVEETISDRYIWNGLWGPKQVLKPWFTEQFEGIDVNRSIEVLKGAEWHTLAERERKELKEKNAVTAITGATISTRAVADGIEAKTPIYLSAAKSRQD